MNSISSNMRENSRRALRGLAVVLSFVVYAAALVYAGVRSYDLFARTLPADMLPLAVLGIVALEVTAMGLPLAIHFWTEPGTQRLTAYGFYALDLALIIGNSVLDAAQNSGTILPEFMRAYGTFAVPGLPVICMLGWALIWLFDPSTREHDMIAATQAAVRASLLEKIRAEVDDADIGADVRSAARAVTRSIVGDTLGQAERRTNTRRTKAQPEPEPTPAPARIVEVAPTTSPKAPSLNGKGGNHHA